MFAAPLSLEQPGWALWAVPLGVGLFMLPLGYGLKVWLFRYLKRWASRTPWLFDDIIFETAERHLFLWVLLAAAFTSVWVATPGDEIRSYVNKAIAGLFVLSITVLAVDLFNKNLRFYSKHINFAVPIAPALRYTVTSILLFLGALFLLSSLGVTTAPLLVLVGVVGFQVDPIIRTAVRLK